MLPTFMDVTRNRISLINYIFVLEISFYINETKNGRKDINVNCSWEIILYQSRMLMTF